MSYTVVTRYKAGCFTLEVVRFFGHVEFNTVFQLPPPLLKMLSLCHGPRGKINIGKGSFKGRRRAGVTVNSGELSYSENIVRPPLTLCTHLPLKL